MCFCNISVNFLCFFFYIRHQYSKSSKKIPKTIKKKILLAKNDIENEQNIKKSNNPDVNKFLFSSSDQNKEEEPVAVSIKREERSSLDFPDFESTNNNPLLPDESHK